MKHTNINGNEKKNKRVRGKEEEEKRIEKEEGKNAWHLYNINILEKQLSATVFQVAGFASATLSSSTDFLSVVVVVVVFFFDVPLFIIVG